MLETLDCYGMRPSMGVHICMDTKSLFFGNASTLVCNLIIGMLIMQTWKVKCNIMGVELKFNMVNCDHLMDVY